MLGEYTSPMGPMGNIYSLHNTSHTSQMTLTKNLCLQKACFLQVSKNFYIHIYI